MSVLDEVVAAVEDRHPRGIAAGISRLVRDGTLPPGTRLPTVRDLGAALGVSPATVSTAWQALANVGLVTSRGRAGTVVRAREVGWLPPRYRDLAAATGAGLDLASGTPDPELLPDLAPVLALVGRAPATTYVDVPVLPALEDHLRASWPFPAEAMTVVDGAFDAMSRTLEAVVRFGDRVVVESPGFPPLVDLLDHLGVERVPVAVDGDGLRPDALAAAVAETSPAALVLQPRAHNPTGASLTEARAAELAAVLRRPDAAGVLVLEDDHSGEIATAPDISLGSHLAGRVVHVRSYSKSHGPDLRIAALGGPASVVDAVVARRMLGPGWTSRMLQLVLLELLTSAAGVTAVTEARRVYHARRHALAQALAEHGVTAAPGDGINMWVPVASETDATVRLAAAGVRVTPGSPFDGPPEDGEHVRVSVGLLRTQIAEVGELLARAARA